jgi:hypothetical protein
MLYKLSLHSMPHTLRNCFTAIPRGTSLPIDIAGNSDHYNITLRLDDVQHIFVAPELTPLAGQFRFISGLEEIVNELKPNPLGPQVHTTIWLPQDQFSDNIEQAAQEAIRKYCDARIHQITNELASLRRQGFKALQTGLIFLAGCLLLSTLFGQMETLPNFLRMFLREGFIIAGWVSLWQPTTILLFDWWTPQRDKRIYTCLKDMELKIRLDQL